MDEASLARKQRRQAAAFHMAATVHGQQTAGIEPGYGWRGVHRGRFGGGDYAEVALLQAADAVAQSGGALEFEILGGFAHLRFELNDGLLQLLFVGDVTDGGRRPLGQ